MKLLLDTHILLWAVADPKRLSAKAASLIVDPDNGLWFSAVSLWEISIKNGLGRSDFQVDTRRLLRLLLANGYRELPISSEHAVAVGSLAPFHKDPFDRLLVAQACMERLMLGKWKLLNYREVHFITRSHFGNVLDFSMLSLYFVI